ncbi:MAG: chemotaxis protein CheW [Pseudomonadota bacterium]
MADEALLARLAELERRSHAHRAALQGEPGTAGGNRGVVFRLAGYTFLVDLTVVDEVSAALPWTPLPGAADWFLGLVNRRGELLTLVDLGAWLLGQPAAPGGDLLVLRRGAAATALRVDDVFGIRTFEPRERQEAEPLPGRAPAFQQGMWDEGETRWYQLDLPSLVEDPAFLEAGGTVKEDA